MKLAIMGVIIATASTAGCASDEERRAGRMIEEWRNTTAVLTPYALTMLYGHPANDATYVRLCKATQAAIPRNRLPEMVLASFIQEIDVGWAAMCRESDVIGMEYCAMWCRTKWKSIRVQVDEEAKVKGSRWYLPSLVLEY